MSQLGSKTKSHFPSLHLWGGGRQPEHSARLPPTQPGGGGAGREGVPQGLCPRPRASGGGGRAITEQQLESCVCDLGTDNSTFLSLYCV